MAKDFSPEVVRAIELAHKVSGAGAAAEDAISMVWGDVDLLGKRARFWHELASDVQTRVIAKMGDEKSGIADGHWTGKASRGYQAWIGDLNSQMDAMHGHFVEIGDAIDSVRAAVEEMRAGVRKICAWFIGAAMGLAFSETGIGIGALAVCTWEFVQNLLDYCDSARGKFDALTVQVRNLRLASRELVQHTEGKLSTDLPIPVDIVRYAPYPPLDQIANWRDWGRSHA